MKKNQSNSWKNKIIALIILVIVAASGGSIVYQDQSASTQSQQTGSSEAVQEVSYTFRNEKLLEEHYEKHGKDMGYDSPEEYEKAASAVVTNKDALHKTEKEDGDDVYYLEETNEFVIVSTDGFLRTYFFPNSGITYYNRQ